MPRVKGRATQTLIDRIHSKTARSIDQTFNHHAKEKTLVPANFIAQAIRFLEKTGSTDAARDSKQPDRLASMLDAYEREDENGNPVADPSTDFSVKRKFPDDQ